MPMLTKAVVSEVGHESRLPTYNQVEIYMGKKGSFKTINLYEIEINFSVTCSAVQVCPTGRPLAQYISLFLGATDQWSETYRGKPLSALN